MKSVISLCYQLSMYFMYLCAQLITEGAQRFQKYFVICSRFYVLVQRTVNTHLGKHEVWQLQNDTGGDDIQHHLLHHCYHPHRRLHSICKEGAERHKNVRRHL
jgi:hypothetical protein